ncbi:MAG: alpha/beta hydrolase [Bacteroidota bacterium]
MSDEQELDPQAAAFLTAIGQRNARGVSELSPEEARVAHNASARELSGPGEAVAKVEDVTLRTGQNCDLPLRVFRPRAATGNCVVLYFHGGGWVVGNLDTYDPLCRNLANDARAIVISVGYRLAPEYQYPSQIEDALVALRWVIERQHDWSPDGVRVIVAGDSAGGNLAAVLTAQAHVDGLHVAGQVLIYPMLDPHLSYPSIVERGKGFFVSVEDVRWYWEQYLPDRAPADRADVAPLQIEDLSHIPPTLILTAGFDPLRDEALAYADRLEHAGVAVTRMDFPGQIHGFVRFTARISAARSAIGRIGQFISDLSR